MLVRKIDEGHLDFGVKRKFDHIEILNCKRILIRSDSMASLETSHSSSSVASSAATTLSAVSDDSKCCETNENITKSTVQKSDENIPLNTSSEPLNESRGGRSNVAKKVKMVMNQWGPVEAIPPERFLIKLLKSRGHESTFIPASNSSFRKVPSSKQLMDYDKDVVGAVRTSNLEKLKDIQSTGRRYDENIHTS